MRSILEQPFDIVRISNIKGPATLTRKYSKFRDTQVKLFFIFASQIICMSEKNTTDHTLVDFCGIGEELQQFLLLKQGNRSQATADSSTILK